MKKPLLLMAFILFASCNDNKETRTSLNLNHTFKQSELNEDFLIMRRALEEAHPGIYRYISKEKLDYFLDSLHSELRQPLTELDFFRFVSPLIAQIRCGHSSACLSAPYRDYMYRTCTFFPLQLKFIANKAYVLKSYATNKLIPMGSEICSINHQSIPDLVPLLFRMFPSDGNIKTAKYRRLDEEFSQLYFRYIAKSDSFTIRYIPYSGATEEVMVLPAKPWDEVTHYHSSYMARQKTPLKFELTDQPSVGILTIVTFIPGIIENNSGDFFRFIDSTFSLLKEKNIENLIIDLRGNNGGDVHYFRYLLSKIIDQPYRIAERIDVPTIKYSFLEYTEHGFFFNLMHSLAYVKSEQTGRYELKGKSGWHQLLNPQEPHFQGKIYILTDGWTFSAASDFCAIADYYAPQKTTFIGEETGGAYYGNNSGDWIRVILPNTQIEVNIPIRYYLLAVFDYAYPDRGIIPDYPVSSSIDDILNDRDIPREFTLSLISQATFPSVYNNQ